MTTTKAPVTPAVLSVADAAAYLGISRSSLYRITAQRGQGSIPVTCIGGRRVIQRTHLDAYLKRNTTA